jgi:hypothetical protein
VLDVGTIPLLNQQESERIERACEGDSHPLRISLRNPWDSREFGVLCISPQKGSIQFPVLQIIAQNKCVSLLSFATEKTRQILVSADDCRSCNFCNTFLYERFLFHCCKCWNEVVGVSPIIPSRAFFLLWLKEPISGELVKEEHPLINRVIAKKSTASFQHLHLRGGIIDCWGNDMLAKIVDALKALAVVNHEFACQPERIEGQDCIFASTVIVDALAGKIAVARRSAQAQLRAHLIQECLMCCCKVGSTCLLLMTSHMQTPDRKFGHGVDAEATTVVKEVVRVVEQVMKIGWLITTHPTPEQEIVTTSDDVEGVHLHFFDGA